MKRILMNVPKRSGVVRLAILWTVLVAGTTACGEKASTAPKPPDPVPVEAVASVRISPASAALSVGQSASLSAVVTGTSGNVLTSRTVTWTSNAPSIATTGGNATGPSVSLSALAPGIAVITATSEGHTSTITVTVSAQPATDFAIVDAQWTQGVQQANGALPMVLDGNAAVVNVLMSTTGPGGAGGQLVLTVSENTGAVVRTDTVQLTNVSSTSPSYASPSAQFLVPAAVIRSGLEWRLQRDPRRVAPDADSLNDRFPRETLATLETVQLPVLRMRFVPITLSAHGNVTGNVSNNNVSAYLPTMSRVVPYGLLETTIGTPLVSSASFGTPPAGGSDSFWLQLLSELDLARVATLAREIYWMGVVAPPSGFTNTAFGGFAYIPVVPEANGPGTRTSLVVNTGWFNNTGQTADLVAHEIGHSLSRRHSPCGGPTGVDPNYPLSNGSIGVSGHDVRSWALGLTTSATVRTVSTGDVMGYCFPQWSSPYTYSGMLNARIANITSAEREATDAMSERQHVIVVRGHVASGRITLLPTVGIHGYPTAESHASSALRISIIDESGVTIASHRVTATETDHSSTRTFVAAIAMSESLAATIAAVRIDGSGTTIRRRRGGVPLGAMNQPGSAVAKTIAEPVAVSVFPRPNTVAITCNVPDAEVIVVQDPKTGDVLGSAPGSTMAISTPSARTVDIICSDGVRSVYRRQLSTSRTPR